ncbi:MAG TPA: UDP-N-acetylmuramoyl-L-alanyl-D-glutamate--2,6-diaminopimelate ligase, partial [Steroidobacteraceae bacterium]|nr:UDP-N-acetylmuramoyl-L-alanyl-D-glutamate--2,6-diaminopimelate ligase [Steroidobacteraceae bacterium]
AADRAPEFSSDVFFARVPELSRHVGTIADRFFGEPSRALKIAGITGTNGKTTTAFLLAQALGFCGRPAAYSGTIGYGLPGALVESTHTTVDAVSVHRQLAEFRRAGVQYVCMEVSSHALHQGRVNGVRFNTAIFTNLTRDHLDYHGSMDEYGAAKALLFATPGLAASVVNVDDEFGAALAERRSSARLIATTRKEYFGLSEFVRASRVRAESSGLVISIESSFGVGEVTVPLVGEFNIENTLSVLGALLALGVPLADAAHALARCRAPSGRMELFGGRGRLPLAIVDYAHTPDALSKALRAARMHCRGRLHVVFGCGGDRDAGKRPLMGTIAAELADNIVITDDNPRTEDPRRIVADIIAGVRGVGTGVGGIGGSSTSASGIRALGPIVARATSVRVEHDRARAITSTLDAAAVEDVVLIAGKGHESYQIYGTEKRPFSDQAVIRNHWGEET